MFKKFMAAIVCASLALSSPAFSASFGKSESSSASKSGSSSGSRTSSPTRSSPAPSRSSSTDTKKSGSISRGESVGMTRSAVTESVRDGSYKRPAPAPTSVPNSSVEQKYANQERAIQDQINKNRINQDRIAQDKITQDRINEARRNEGYGGYNGGYRPQPQPQAYGMGTVAGAAAAGALVGYMLHRDSNGNSYYTHPNNPNIAYDANGNRMNSMPQGSFTARGTVASNGTITPPASGNFNDSYAARTPPTESSSGFGWIVFLFLLLAGAIGAAIYFMNRRKVSVSVQSPRAQSPSTNFVPVPTPKEILASTAQQMFIDFQKNNMPSGINVIESQSDSVFFDAIKDSVLSASDNKKVTVKSIETELVNVEQENGQLVGSVHYRGVINEQTGSDINKITVDEVWHYVYKGGKWLLAGIEPVNPEINEDVDGNPEPKYQF